MNFQLQQCWYLQLIHLIIICNSDGCKLYNVIINFNDLLEQLTCHDLLETSTPLDSSNIVSQIVLDTLYEKYFGWYMYKCMNNDCSNREKCKKLMYNECYETLFSSKIFAPTMHEFRTYLTNKLNNLNNNQSLFKFKINDFVRYCEAKVKSTQCHFCFLFSFFFFLFNYFFYHSYRTVLHSLFLWLLFFLLNVYQSIVLLLLFWMWRQICTECRESTFNPITMF